MADLSQDHLHRLIHSMDRAEKRYFKLYTSRHMLGKKSNYQVLFDAVAQMKTYDECALIQQFKNEAFTRRFAIAKRRLYETILKSLDAFHAENSPDARLWRALHQVEILFKRGLYTDASKMLRSVRRAAEKQERHSVLIDVQTWERRLMERTNYTGVRSEHLRSAQEETQQLIQCLQELGELWYVKSDLFLTLYRKGQVRDPNEKKALNELTDRPVMTRSPKQLGSAQARYLHHHIHSARAFAIGDLATCREHLHKSLRSLETDGEKFNEVANLRLSALSNLTYVCMRMGRFDEAKVTLARSKALPKDMERSRTADLDLRIFATSFSLELSVLTQTGRFAQALSVLPAVMEGLERYSDRLGTARKAGFYYLIAYTYFGAGEMNLALRWAHKLLNEVHIDESEEVVCFGQLLNLLIHLEIGNSELLPYALRSTERYLRTRKKVYRFEPVFLDMVRRLMRSKTDEEADQLYAEYHTEFLSLEKDPLERPVFENFDPLAWVESKLNRTSFAKAVETRMITLRKAA